MPTTINTGNVKVDGTGQNVNTGGVSGTGGVKGSGNAPTPPSTSGDLSGAPTPPTAGNGDIFMRPPTLDTASLMVQMASLQSQMADNQTKLADETIKGQRTEMMEKQKERIQQLQDYFKSQKAKGAGGFFGKIFRAIKCLFTGDFKGFADNLKEGFSKDVITGLLFCVAVAWANILMPGYGTLVALAAFTPAMMGDKDLMNDVADILNIKGDARTKFLDAMHWTGFASEIVLDLAFAITVSVATAGTATPAMVAFLTAKAAVIGARETERGVRDYQANKTKAEGMESYAEADRLQATTMKLKAEIDKNMGRISDFFDTYTSIIQSTTQALQKQYDAANAAAKSV
ncbi:MAG: hypothetical protein MI749_09790 [Desulfovibrionales bacterium]|nr:hypothetical protein [Desulfovibrionales bacterium]